MYLHFRLLRAAVAAAAAAAAAVAFVCCACVLAAWLLVLRVSVWTFRSGMGGWSGAGYGISSLSGFLLLSCVSVCWRTHFCGSDGGNIQIVS